LLGSYHIFLKKQYYFAVYKKLDVWYKIERKMEMKENEHSFNK